MELRLARIADKLAAVRTRGPSCLGSNTHRFSLGERAADADVAAFEAARGVTLPADYRAFITTVGHGGAGPYYGLYALDQWDRERDDPVEDLGAPCPLHPATLPPGSGWLEALMPDLDPDLALDRCLQGTMSIGTQGCSGAIQLVVSGTARGRVLYVDLQGGRPYFPEHDDFLGWYERWLDELLNGCTAPGFGLGMPGFEPELREALCNDRRPADALRALARLPRVGPQCLALIRAHVDDPRPAVRRAAVSTLGVHDDDAAALARPLLDDPNPDIREAALRTIERSDIVRWQHDVYAMLDDPEPTLARRALSALATANLLTVAQLAPLTDASRPALRRTAMQWLRTLTTRGLDADDAAIMGALAREWLDDTHEDVAFEGLLILTLVDEDSVQAQLERHALGPSRRLRVVACSALLRQAPEVGMQALLELTRSDDPFTRQGAARLLGEQGDRRAIPALETLLDDITRPRELRNGTTAMTNVFRVCETARMAIAHIRGRDGAAPRR
ncbi:MAG: HEAT repeat domain-containing protein [Deltaproteobacteria bacterium]|nr:HEAT repeat domain-containing protein [Deltaproteobacteria bacterium]